MKSLKNLFRHFLLQTTDLPRRVKAGYRLQTVLFLLLIFLLPTQLGRHFWPDWALVNGVRVDYLAPTIYVTDILIFLLIIINLFRRGKARLAPTLIIFLLLISLLSHFSPISLLKFLKFLEIILFAWVIKSFLQENPKNLSRLIFVLSLSLLFQSALAIVQFFNHGSLNGIFYWFGERFFTGNTPGIANASLNGQLILRPYGTFPHPNVLAVFLLMGITLVLSFLRKQESYYVGNLNSKRSKQDSSLRWNDIEKISNGTGTMKQWNNAFIIFVVVIASLALFLTLSRTAIILWTIFFIFIFFRRGGLSRFAHEARRANPPHVPPQAGLRAGQRPAPTIIIVFLVSLIFLFPLLSPRFSSLLSEDKESWQKRIEQNQIALAMWRDHPLFGVGLNHYLIELSHYQKIASYKDFQPVHNIALLTLAEGGIMGFLLIYAAPLLYGFMALWLRNNHRTIEPFSYLIIIIFVLSLVDHFFYTTQQGNLMIGLLIGLI